MRDPGFFCRAGMALLALALTPAFAFSQQGPAVDDFARCNRSVDNPDEGIKACTRLLEPGLTGVNVPAVYNNRGNAWINKGLLNNAIADFTAAIQRDPNFVDAYRNRGLAWHRSGNFDPAIADFNYAIERAANSAPLYNARGSALLSKGEFNRAIADFDRAIALDSRYAAAFNNRGLALQSLRLFDRAIADFNRVISLVPRDAAGYNNRASVWMDRANFSAAIKDYDEAIRLQPNDWRGYSSRGEARRLTGDLNRALADHNEAIKRDRTAVDAYNNRAIVWRDKGELDRAMADYDEAILLNPRYDRAYASRGGAHQLFRLCRRDCFPASSLSFVLESSTRYYLGFCQAAFRSNRLHAARPKNPNSATAEEAAAFKKTRRHARARGQGASRSGDGSLGDGRASDRLEADPSAGLGPHRRASDCARPSSIGVLRSHLPDSQTIVSVFGVCGRYRDHCQWDF
jgi:tetratricopeptide (TPR) repeat protein